MSDTPNPFLSPSVGLVEIMRRGYSCGVLVDFDSVTPDVGVVVMSRAEVGGAQRVPAEWNATAGLYEAKREHVEEAFAVLG